MIWNEGNFQIRRGCFFGILRVLQIISTRLHCLLPLNRALGYPLLRLRSKCFGGNLSISGRMFFNHGEKHITKGHVIGKVKR